MKKFIVLFAASLCFTQAIAQQTLTPDSTATGSIDLSEVSVTADMILRKNDRLIIYPDAKSVDRSIDAVELIGNLNLPQLIFNHTTNVLQLAKKVSLAIV